MHKKAHTNLWVCPNDAYVISNGPLLTSYNLYKPNRINFEAKVGHYSLHLSTSSAAAINEPVVTKVFCFIFQCQNQYKNVYRAIRIDGEKTPTNFAFKNVRI